jgi:hypothetical protein
MLTTKMSSASVNILCIPVSMSVKISLSGLTSLDHDGGIKPFGCGRTLWMVTVPDFPPGCSKAFRIRIHSSHQGCSDRSNSVNLSLSPNFCADHSTSGLSPGPFGLYRRWHPRVYIQRKSEKLRAGREGSSSLDRRTPLPLPQDLQREESLEHEHQVVAVRPQRSFLQVAALARPGFHNT